ncbi:MAG: lipoyl(octanoyl) transferase [Isosphaeraceae bacterium]|nr:lipoyl(octanoyl) transferase [Isosphaeraceae bacterium]
MSDPGTPPALEVYLLGLVDFDEMQALQRRIVYDLGERDGAALVLCEHPPTISVGRSGSRMHIRPDDDALQAMEIPIRWVNRGGGCTLHLPGQVVGYFALPLDRMGLTLQGHLDGLVRMLTVVLREFGLPATNPDDSSGVFLGNARVATVGVAVNRWIAYHGFTLNVGPFLEPFRVLLDEPAPGGRSLRQTSMEAWRQRPTPPSQVRESLIRGVEREFGLERRHLFTRHPSLRRKVRTHVHAESRG